jgi:probable rRNA maturation factor
MPVQFFEEDISYKLKNKAAVKKWITDTVRAEGFILKELSYIFCSDIYLLQVNRQFLNHNYFTDIITFDNSAGDGLIVGDIFISIERVRENAAKFNMPLLDELHRVIIHGVLHLVGYNDKTPADKEKMTLKEDFYLTKRSFIG